MIHQFWSKRFATFLLTGGIAATVNFGSRIVYSHWINFAAAVVLAYITGMVTAFVLARLFVFPESRQDIHRSAMFFVMVNIVALAQTWAVSMTLAYYVLPAAGVRAFVPEISHAAGVLVPVFTSYLGHKRWSFR